MMPKAPSRQDTANLSEAVVAQTFELGALPVVVERKGVLTKAEVLGEIQRLREKVVKAD